MKRMFLLLAMTLAATVPAAADATECDGRERLRWLLGDWTADGGNDLDLQIRYLAVYARVDGAWQLRSWQSLRVP